MDITYKSQKSSAAMVQGKVDLFTPNLSNSLAVDEEARNCQ